MAHSRDHRGRGKALSLVMRSLVCGGYLGGHLTFVKAVNVNHTAWPAGPDAWTQVCAVADPADGTPRKVDAAGVPILLTAEVTPSRRSMPPELTWADRWPTANSPRLRNLPLTRQHLPAR